MRFNQKKNRDPGFQKSIPVQIPGPKNDPGTGIPLGSRSQCRPLGVIAVKSAFLSDFSTERCYSGHFRAKKGPSGVIAVIFALKKGQRGVIGVIFALKKGPGGVMAVIFALKFTLRSIPLYVVFFSLF